MPLTTKPNITNYPVCFNTEALLQQVVKIQLTSEQEMCFLHHLTVHEDDFQNLKADQGIVVDFASFPAKLASLLDRCADADSDWPLK